MFGYCAFNIENFLNYYEVYIENKIFNKPIRSYYLNKEKLELINKIDGYLKIIVELREYDNENTFIDIKETPNYFQIFIDSHK